MGNASSGQSSGEFDASFIPVSSGEFWEKYERLQELGRGAGGVVYLVRRKDDGTELVAKEAHTMKDTKATQEMWEEFTKMKMYSAHPNILTMIELLKSPDSSPESKGGTVIYIITEVARGGDLGNTMKKRTDAGFPMTEQWVAGIFMKAMSGVAHLHYCGLKHSDLKPDNLLVLNAFDANNPDQISDVVIADFGCATFAKERKCQCGDPRYMCPQTWRVLEASQAGKPIPPMPDLETDIWAMGVTLFELMSGGEIPFLYSQCTLDDILQSDAKYKELGQQVTDDNVKVLVREKLDADGHRISDQVDDLIKTMLIKNGKARPIARDVLGHAWFTMEGGPIYIKDTVVEKMRLRRVKSRAHQILRTAMATRLQRDHLAECEAIFNQVDKDKSGFIEEGEFLAAYKLLLANCGSEDLPSPGSSRLSIVNKYRAVRQPSEGSAASGSEEAESRKIFRAAVISEQQGMTFTEFVAVTFDWNQLETAELNKRLEALFQTIDQDSSQSISQKELKDYFRGSLEDEDFEEAWVRMDRDGNNEVSVEEFQCFMLHDHVNPDHCGTQYQCGPGRYAVPKTPPSDNGHAKACCTCVSVTMVLAVLAKTIGL